MLNHDMYATMLNNDECWFVWAAGCGIIICDCSLMDC